MFEILLKIKLTKLERFFLKNNRKFVLQSKEESKNKFLDSSDPEDYLNTENIKELKNCE